MMNIDSLTLLCKSMCEHVLSFTNLIAITTSQHLRDGEDVRVAEHWQRQLPVDVVVVVTSAGSRQWRRSIAGSGVSESHRVVGEAEGIAVAVPAVAVPAVAVPAVAVPAAAVPAVAVPAVAVPAVAVRGGGSGGGRHRNDIIIVGEPTPIFMHTYIHRVVCSHHFYSETSKF